MGQIVKKYTPTFCEKIYPIISDHAGDGESDHAGYEDSEHAGYDPGAQVFLFFLDGEVRMARMDRSRGGGMDGGDMAPYISYAVPKSLISVQKPQKLTKKHPSLLSP